MTSDFKYFKGDEDKAFNIASMQKYVSQKQELDKLLEKLIQPYISGKSLSVLDACCGIGHLSNILSEISPNSKFTGVDQTPYLIEEAHKLFSSNSALKFEISDVNSFVASHTKEFDISISWKTISWLPNYEEMMNSLMYATKKHIFLSSLFYDGDIDFEIKVKEYEKERGQEGSYGFYNVYSLPRFKRFMFELGAKNIEASDFEIGIDLPKPDKNVMGTYTELLQNGKRIQISGAVVMLWKILRIDL